MAAKIGRHPIHPMLIVFPIGLWVFSLIADLILLYGGEPFWRELSFFSMVGGLIGALVAALPGMIDYWSMGDSPARKIATRHMTLNLIVVALYAANIWLRWETGGVGGWPLVLSLVAVFLLAISGWLGGELVYVHGVAVEKTPSAPTIEKEAPLHRDDYRRMAHGRISERQNSGKEGRL